MPFGKSLMTAQPDGLTGARPCVGFGDGQGAATYVAGS